MVYRGKPSAACAECRRKRRKCDKKTPSCSQCIRARCRCTGYRDASKLHIRNDTDLVIRKVSGENVSQNTGIAKTKDKSENTSRSTAPHATDDAWNCLMTTNWEDALSLFSLPIKAEDVALQYYMTTYAPTTVFSYLPTFWSDFSNNTQATLAITTSALACWAREFRQPDLMRLAHHQYTKTIVQTNRALSDPGLAALDGTLLSCLLLSTFEALMFSGRKTPHSWMAHVRGCSTLLCLRGKKQLDSVLGRYLFNHASSIIRTYCSLYSAPLPPGLTRLQRHAARVLDRSDPMVIMGPLLDRFAALRATLKGAAATDVVREALYLDRECLTLLDTTTKMEAYEIKDASDYSTPLRTYRGIVHEYTDQGIARWYNVLRLIRLTLNEWIFCAFDGRRGIAIDEPPADDPLAESWAELQMRALAKGQDVIDDILASVPYSFDLLKESVHSPSTPARFLIWPLATLGTADICPEVAKAFSIDRLEALGKIRGLEQASLAAQMVKAGDSLEDWVHLLHFA